MNSISLSILLGMSSLPVILCIGTDKVPGDSLGPRVGRLLKDVFKVNAFVYGDSKRPVTALNFTEFVRHIENVHKGSFLIAVDACLGRPENVGSVKVSTQGVTAGGAFNKGLKTVGDLGFLGVVAEAGDDNLKMLFNVENDFVQRLSIRIALKIMKVLKNLPFIENI